MRSEIPATQRIIRNYWVSSATTVQTAQMILPRNLIYDGLGSCSWGTSSVQTSSTFFRLGLKQLKMRRLLDRPTCWITMFSAHIFHS